MISWVWIQTWLSIYLNNVINNLVLHILIYGFIRIVQYATCHLSIVRWHYICQYFASYERRGAALRLVNKILQMKLTMNEVLRRILMIWYETTMNFIHELQMPRWTWWRINSSKVSDFFFVASNCGSLSHKIQLDQPDTTIHERLRFILAPTSPGDIVSCITKMEIVEATQILYVRLSVKI